MSHPTLWPQLSFFYAIGNTPPICLTDHLPPEEDAVVLLLGCGDPRNILYTVSVDHRHPNRAMDITCCDWDPAIIARNALILTLVADSIDADRLVLYWSIFYDLFLDRSSISLLKDQCTKLSEYAINITTWNTSPYGRFIKFTTEETLHEARHHWVSYVETLALSNAQQEQLKRVFLSTMKKHSASEDLNLSAMLSAAPLSAEFLPLSTGPQKQYWKTGITSPNVAPNATTQINPTFLFSMAGRKFSLHYGTDLCSAFHLALALAKVTFDDGTVWNPGKTERELWNACHEQFSRWAIAFHRQLAASEKPTIILRFVVGEALALCDGLQLCRAGDLTPTIYSSMWGSKKFSFHDHTMPTSFNVIDTSNLSDHLGLLNVLVAVTPLLQKSPYAVLNTSSLLSYKEHPTQRSAIEERVLLDFRSLALLLGIVPLCYSSGLAFRNCSEAASFSAVLNIQGRHYERVSWKFSEYAHTKWDGTSTQRSHRTQFEPGDLANRFFDVYLKMFENEDVGSLLGRLHTRDLNKKAMQDIHYTRQSFVRFLNVVRSLGFVETDWSKTLDRFINHVTTNTDLLLGANNFQSLFTDLHIWGLYSEQPLLPDFVVNLFGPKPAPYQSWATIPPVVCLVLKVPRLALKALEDIPSDKFGNPPFECETFFRHAHNIHDSIRTIFGDIVDFEGRKAIIEDSEGLSGSSPLIISFFAPSWILAQNPTELKVGLCFKKTPTSSFKFTAKLGPELRIYSTELLNEANVFILRERPDNQGELQRRASMNQPQQNAEYMLGVTRVVKTKEAGEILSKKLNVTEAPAKEALMNKASVDIRQTTPFCMEVTIDGHHRYLLFYPVHVDGSRSRTRIARKSSYIEVDVPPHTSPLSQLTILPFPMTFNTSNGRPLLSCWNAPYVNLDYFPTISLSKIPTWASTHLSFCMSRQERHLQRSMPAETWKPSLNFKASITNILLRHAQEKHMVYVLQDKSQPRPYAIILLSSIRMDSSSATILGDAVVIFPNPTITHLVSRALEESGVVLTYIYDEELFWWSHALPVFAERCRQWEHLTTCQYLQRQCIPLSVEYGKPPLCSCGQGQNLGPFLKSSQWKGLAPHAIRIAITPIFPVTYLEDVTEPAMGDILKGKKPTSALLNSLSSSAKGNSGRRDDDRCRRCEGAGKPKLLRCGRCQLARYCSKECQVADWKQHKPQCEMLRKLPL